MFLYIYVLKSLSFFFKRKGQREFWDIKRSKCVFTSMRKAGEWRTREIGSPWRSVKSEILPLFPTSHLLSKSSTSKRSFFRSNSLTTITPSASIISLSLSLSLYLWNSRSDTTNWAKQTPQGKRKQKFQERKDYIETSVLGWLKYMSKQSMKRRVSLYRRK